MFILSHSKLNIESKQLLYKSFKTQQPKEGYAIKSPNHAVIWSQMFISSQSKLSLESKKFFYKSFKADQPKEGSEIKYSKVCSHLVTNVQIVTI